VIKSKCVSYILSIGTCVLTLYSYAAKQELLLPDFLQTTYIQDFRALSSSWTKFLLGASGTRVLYTFQSLYDQARHAEHIPESIPKKIHQIWLGSPLPKKYKHFQQLIKKFHPDWEYKLWTDNDIKNLELINQQTYDAAPNFGEKSDIARYEILYNFGGIYLDIDVECLRSFDFLRRHYGFFAALEPLLYGSPTCLSLANAIIGARPGHPVLKECIIQIYRSHKLHKFNHLPRTTKTIITTGPVLFTRACYAQRSQLRKDGIILPSECFTPLRILSLPLTAPWRFCIHHWTHSWMKAAISPLSLHINKIKAQTETS
jgi:hypothetical protein